MPDPKLSIVEFSQKIKEKYPAYKDINDTTLVNKILEKYPEYQDRVDFAPAPAPTAQAPATPLPFNVPDYSNSWKDTRFADKIPPPPITLQPLAPPTPVVGREKRLDTSTEPKLGQIQPLEASTTATPNVVIPNRSMQDYGTKYFEPGTTTQQAREDQKNPEYASPLDEKRQEELVSPGEDYISTQVSQGYHGLRMAATGIEDLLGINPNAPILKQPEDIKGVLTENPNYKSAVEKKIGAGLDVVNGIAHAAFAGMALTPSGAAFMGGVAMAPEEVTNWVFAPANSIAETVGYTPKEGSIQEKLLTTGDIFGSIFMMKGSTKLAGKIKKNVKLTDEELVEVKGVMDSVTPEDIRNVFENNPKFKKRFNPVFFNENKVVDVIENVKNGNTNNYENILNLDVPKETFDQVLKTAIDTKHIAEADANILKQQYEQAQIVKNAVPPQHKTNPRVLKLVDEKLALEDQVKYLEAQKKTLDDSFHPKLDLEIEKSKAEIQHRKLKIANEDVAKTKLDVETPPPIVPEAKVETPVAPELMDAKGRLDEFKKMAEGTSSKEFNGLLSKNPKGAYQSLIDFHTSQMKGKDANTAKFHLNAIKKFEALKKDYDSVYGEGDRANELKAQEDKINQARAKAIADIKKLQADNPLVGGVEELIKEVEADHDTQIKALTEPKKLSTKSEEAKKKLQEKKAKKGEMVIDMGEGKPQEVAAKTPELTTPKVETAIPTIENAVVPEALGEKAETKVEAPATETTVNQSEAAPKQTFRKDLIDGTVEVEGGGEYERRGGNWYKPNGKKVISKKEIKELDDALDSEVDPMGDTPPTEQSTTLEATPKEQPKAEAPKVEAPKVEAPKVEAPVVEVPKVEEKKVEVTPPVAEAPKVEAAKTPETYSPSITRQIQNEAAHIVAHMDTPEGKRGEPEVVGSVRQKIRARHQEAIDKAVENLLANREAIGEVTKLDKGEIAPEKPKSPEVSVENVGEEEQTGAHGIMTIGKKDALLQEQRKEKSAERAYIKSVADETMTPEASKEFMAKWDAANGETVKVGTRGVEIAPEGIQKMAIQDLAAKRKGRVPKRSGKELARYEKNKEAVDAEVARMEQEGMPDKEALKAEKEKAAEKETTKAEVQKLWAGKGVGEFVKETKEVTPIGESPIVAESVTKAVEGGAKNLSEVIEAHRDILGEDFPGSTNTKLTIKHLAERGVISQEKAVQLSKMADKNLTVNLKKEVKPQTLAQRIKEAQAFDTKMSTQKEAYRKKAFQRTDWVDDATFDKEWDAKLRVVAKKVFNGLKMEAADKDLSATFGSMALPNREMVRKVWNATMDAAMMAVDAGAKVSDVVKNTVEYIKGTDWYKAQTLKVKGTVEGALRYHISEGLIEAERLMGESEKVLGEARTKDVEGAIEKVGDVGGKDRTSSIVENANLVEGEKLKYKEGAAEPLSPAELEVAKADAESVEAKKKDFSGFLTDVLIPKVLVGLEKLGKEEIQRKLEAASEVFEPIKKYWENAVNKATGKTLDQLAEERGNLRLDHDEMMELKNNFPEEFKDIFEMGSKFQEGFNDWRHIDAIAQGKPLSMETKGQMRVLKVAEMVKNGLFPDLGVNLTMNGFIRAKDVKAMIDLTADLVNIAIKAGFRGKELVDKVLKDLKDSKFYEQVKGGEKFDETKFDRKATKLIEAHEKEGERNANFNDLKEAVDSMKEDGFTAEDIAKELDEPLVDVQAAYNGATSPPPRTSAKGGKGTPPTPPSTSPGASLPPSSPGKMASDIDATMKMVEKQRTDADSHRENTKTLWDKFMKTMVDRSARIKNAIEKIDPAAGYKARREFELRAGATATTAHEYTKAIQDIYGTLKDGIMSSKEQKILADYIQFKRTIELDKLADAKGEPRQKHPGNVTSEQIANTIDGMKSNDPAILKAYGVESIDVAKLDALTEKYTNVMKEKLKEKLDAGLISQEAYDELKDLMYSPRKFIQHLDPSVDTKVTSTGTMSVPGSGIKELGEGSEQSLINNPQLLMLEVIGRTNELIAKNKANQALAEFAKANPDNGIVEIAKITPEYIANPKGNPTYIDAPNKWVPIDYMDNGVRKRMNVLGEFAEDWKDKDPILSEAASKFITHASGSSVLKFLATTANPEFAVGNFFRDMAHIYLTTDVYSPHVPKYTAQMASDIATVFPDVMKRTGRVQEYINDGGGMDLLSDQALPKTKIGKYNPVTEGTNTLLDVVGYVGQTSELLTRMAIRERSIINDLAKYEKQGVTVTPEMLKEIKRDATYKARNYMDFSQGGTWAKTADKGIPYLNAGIQGTRGLFRAATTNPKQFGVKVANLAGLTTIITAWNLADDDRKKAYENDIAPLEKASNFIIMTGTWETDENGRKRYHYIKIPKDQGQQLITGAIEDGLKSSVYGIKNDKIMTERRWLELNHMISSLPSTANLPPMIKAMFAYDQNRNIFYDDNIWKGREVGDKTLEQTTNTPYVYSKGAEELKKFGMNISPERAKVAVEQVIPKNSTLGTLGGMGVVALTGGMSPKEKYATEKSIGEQISKMFGARKLFGMTNPDVKVTKVKEVTNLKNDVLTKHDLALDKKAASFGSDISKWTEAQAKEIADWANTFEPDEAARLIERAKSHNKGADFWTVTLKNSPTDVAAKVFADEWKIATEEEKQNMKDRGVKVNLFTPKFIELFNKFTSDTIQTPESEESKLIKSKFENPVEQQ